jgi:type F conjugative transfer system protein TrbI
MNRAEDNGHATQAIEEPLEQVAGGPPPSVNSNTPYVPQKNKVQPLLKGNGRLLVLGAGIVLVLLMLAFNGISRRSSPASTTAGGAGRQTQTRPSNGGRAPESMTPIMDTGRSPAQDVDGSLVNPEQIGRTATRLAKPNPGANLGGVRPFDNTQSWQPAPFQPGPQPPDLAGAQPITAVNPETRAEHDAMDKASLVFVRSSPSSAASAKSAEGATVVEWGVGLAPGTRLRARLESTVSTAVRTPVVAVIEYNYEENGEIVIPAGAKAFGHLEAADASGYLGIRFDSLMMPDGSTMSLEAAATNLQLRPLRGKVEGKHTGKNILVRSFAGVGEIAATLVGRGSLNQPLSEGDLLRERVSDNIGQASDQTVANLMITEHVVVSVPADTEIYVILQKPAKENAQSWRTQPQQAVGQPSIEELRQLMQLQRELNQTTATKPAPE